MAYIVSFIAQKGGVGKSTLARALAREASAGGWSVKVADLDTQQGTVADWHRVRQDNGYDAIGSVEVIGKAAMALKDADNYDLLVLDAGARASAATAELAKASDLAVLPTCASRDDLMPAIRLAKELVKAGIPREQLAFALTRVTTEAEIREARDFITDEAGFTVLEGCLYEKPAYRQAQNDVLAITETRYMGLNKKAATLMQSIIDKIAQS